MTIKFKSIRLENFQSHVDTTIELKDGLNVFIGPSDSGKSAIFRGVRWALFNEPSGTFFIRNGSKEARVTITFKDGRILVRGRSVSCNYYELHDSKGKVRLESFGQGVPKEVVDFTNIRKIELNNGEVYTISMQGQLESPFLLTATSAQKAAAIGRLSGVHILDHAIKDIARELANSKQITKHNDEEISHKEKLLEEFKTLDKEREIFQLALSEARKIDHHKKFIAEIIKIQESLRENGYRTHRISIINQALSFLEEAKELSITINKKKQKLEILLRIKEIYSALKNEEKCIESHLNALKDLSKAQMDESELETKLTIRNDLVRSISVLNAIQSKEKRLRLYASLDLQIAQALLNEMTKKCRFQATLCNIKILIAKNMRRIQIGEEYRLAYVKIDDALEALKTIETKIHQQEQLSFINTRNKRLDSDITTNKDIFSKLIKYQNQLLLQYESILKKLGRCPLCMQPIQDHDTERILDEIGG